MKVTMKGNLIRRLGALVLSALLALSPLGGLISAQAEMAPLPVSIALFWNDHTSSSMATPIPAPGYENSLWLYAPQDAVAADARLTVADLSGQYARFALAPGLEIPLDGLPLSQLVYMDAGAEPGMNYVEILAFDGLGQTAANPVLSTLRFFRNEYEDHIYNHTCTAKSCRALIHFEITDACKGCTLCARNCPVNAISGEKKQMHVIDQDVCIKCGKCEEHCNFNAIIRK